MKRFLPLLAAFCLVFTGCNTPKEEESSSLPTEIIVSGTTHETTEAQLFPIEICGTEIKHEAKKVVSLSPAATEIIAELGFADRLAARSTYCDYPELSTPTVGSSENPDIEAITELSPDVVFTLSALSERDIYALNDEGCAVVQLRVPTTIEQYGRLYCDIASAFIGEEAAKPYGDEAVKRLKEAAEGIDLGNFIYVTDKLTAAGEGTFENSVLSLCGENLCTAEGYSELLTLQGTAPDYMIVSDSLDLSDISYDEVLSVLIYNGAEVVFVSPSAFERPSLRTADVFETITAALSEEIE